MRFWLSSVGVEHGHFGLCVLPMNCFAYILLGVAMLVNAFIYLLNYFASPLK